ncbi:prostaglandin D2 receptor 2 [Mugil cephalus]|uniref:prostaglandin D2 receptor 2 n=1 Tax=Mugil cephalus TaxID=48193 RepID=UPI001FB585FB|nr:prostaglandin D2 receptor 2 [Mugil cephalus]XP_047432317.1 prostaglandin D2 receptor 2 [Mugil cephalus]
MSNSAPNSSVVQEPLLCPQLQIMRNSTSNKNMQVNLTVVCFHGLLSCMGILENALIIWVVGFRLRHRTVASVWVLNLAISDFLATLTLPLFTTYLNSLHSWEMGNPLCKAQASIFFFNMFVSAFLLAAISLDRLLLVVKPVWSQNHRSVTGAWKVCILGWLWAAINTLPYTLFRSVIETKDQRKLCYHNFALYLSSDATLDRECNLRQTTTAISKLLLAFLFPLVVIAGSYIKIGLSLRSRHMRRKQSVSRIGDTLITSNRETRSVFVATKTTHFLLKPQTISTESTSSPNTSNESSHNQLSQSFTRMVTSLIAAFVLCWAPYHVFCLIEVTAQYKRENLKLVQVGLPIATTFAFLNPVLNPILYAFSCPHFWVRIRQSLGAVFDGLVEEGGGLLTVPGKGIRAHIRQKSSRDVDLATPGSQKNSYAPCQTPIPSPLLPERLRDRHIDHTGCSKVYVE